MEMIGDRFTVDASLPSKIPLNNEDICSISHSDLYHRLKEILFGKPSKKVVQTYGKTINPGSLVIPLDAVLPLSIRKTPVNFQEIQSKIRKFTNGIMISSVDPNSIWALDVLIQKLYENNKITIEKTSTYFCDYCRTVLSVRDVKFLPGELKTLYCKIKISESTYFIYYGDEDVVLNLEGVLINKFDKFYVEDQGNEKWIVQTDVHKKLLEKELIFPTKYVEKNGEEIINEFKNFNPILSENKKTRLLSGEVSRDDEQILGNNAKKLEFEIIEHEIIQGNVPHCKYCGKVVKRKRTKGVYIYIDHINTKFYPQRFENSLKTRKMLISKDFKNFPKIPILECDSCGKIEYGSIEKPCACGGTMKNNYSYDPAILPVGIYAMTQSIKNKAYLNHKNFKERYPIFIFMSGVKSNYITDVSVKYLDVSKINLEQVDHEISRLMTVIKKSGILHNNDIVRIQKLKNKIENILNYSLIYGTINKETMADQYVLSTIERFKKYMFEMYDKFDLRNLTIKYEDLINNVSKNYIKIIRGEKINTDVIQELCSISYPFFPNTILNFLNKSDFDLYKIESGKFMVNEMLEKIFEDIFKINLEIPKVKIKNGIPTGRPINKMIIETDIRFIPVFVNIKKELKKLFNTIDIEITDSWKGLEYKVVLKRDKLGEIYKPLANTIELILQKIDAKKLKNDIEKSGYNVGVEGQLITITSNMVDFILKLPDGYESIKTSNIVVYLDLNTNEEIENLFVYKKLKRRISYMKNKLKVEYDDFIKLSISDSQILKKILNPYLKDFKKELKIVNINFTDRINEVLVLNFEEILEGGIDIGISPMFKKYKIKALMKLPSITEDEAEKLFNAGYYSIMEIKSDDIKNISEKADLPITKVKIIQEYLSNIQTFKIVKAGDKYFCPMCETEIPEYQPFCPKCNTPLGWE